MTNLPPSNRDKVRYLLRDIQQDRHDYQVLGEMLQQQYRLLLKHDANELQRLHQQQIPLMQTLANRAKTRQGLLTALGLPANEQGMRQLLDRLPSQLTAQVDPIWTALQQQVESNRQQNDRNGQLLASQMEVLRHLMQQPTGYAALQPIP